MDKTEELLRYSKIYQKTFKEQIRQQEDPEQIDLLAYLAELGGDLSPTDIIEHYQVIKPALARLQGANAVAYSLALQEIKKKLGISSRVVKADLAGLADPPPPAAAAPRALLEQMGQTRPLRLPQDFVDGVFWYGVIAGKDKLLLNSRRELLTLAQAPPGLSVVDRGFDTCRLSKAMIERFLAGETVKDGALLEELASFFARFAVFREPRLPLLLAAWTLGTYCYRLFRVFPYLVLRSPEKRCGKSRVLDLLSLLAFNATARIVYPSEALIFRGPARNGGTVLLDEVEALKHADKEGFSGLLAILNSGFEQSGSVSRMQKTAHGEFLEVAFETYCPRALAGINAMAETLEDRAIIVVMQRKLAQEGVARFSRPRLEGEAQALRDRCYSWVLHHATALAETYEHADVCFASVLAPLDDRARDLWEPLLSIAAVADAERGDVQTTATQALADLAVTFCQVRNSAAEESTTLHVVRALRRIVAQQRQNTLWGGGERESLLTPSELADRLKEELGWERLSTKGLAALLTPLGICAKGTKRDGKVIRAYHLHEQHLAELGERYDTPPAEDEKNNFLYSPPHHISVNPSTALEKCGLERLTDG